MKTAPMPPAESTRSWTFDGKDLVMPCVIRDASMAATVYMCAATGARRVLEQTPYEPATLLGRALSMLIAVKYRDGDLGVYDEIGLGVLVKGPGGKVGPMTVDLPVTGEFTRQAGREVWGLPKYMMEASIVPESRQTRLEASADGMWILGGSIAGTRRIPGTYRAKMTSFSYVIEGPKAGRRMRMDSEVTSASGVRMRLGGSTIMWGQHPMALRARQLGMAGSPMMSITIARASMVIPAARLER